MTAIIDCRNSNLKPGGWAEFQDWDTQPKSDDGTLTPESYLQKWTTIGTDACVKIGLDPSPGPKLEQWMKDAGFVDVQTKVHKLPLGTWPKDKRLKEIGAWTRLVLMDEGMEAMTMELLTEVMKWSVEEVQVLLAKVRPEVIKSEVHAYYHL